MITKVKDGPRRPRRNYDSFDYPCSEEMMSSKQRNLLIELILTKIEDEENREGYLSQISDNLSSSDANEMIFELEMARY